MVDDCVFEFESCSVWVIVGVDWVVEFVVVFDLVVDVDVMLKVVVFGVDGVDFGCLVGVECVFVVNVDVDGFG